MAQVEVKWVFPGAKEAADSIKKIEDSLKKTGDTAKESTDKMTGAFDSNIKSLAAWAAGFATVSAATAFLKDAVAAAVESQKETALLARQVEAAGVSWEKYGQRIDEIIQASSAYGRVQDEEVSAALREMVTMTNDVRASTENLNLVVDLAYAKNMSLSQAAQIVGKAMEGDIRAVAQFLPELKRLDETLGANATTAQKVQATLNTLSERFRGAAETMPEFEKQTKDLNLAWEDFKETVGSKAIPVLTNLLEWSNKTVDSLKKQSEQLQTSTSWWEKFSIAASQAYILGDIVKGINDITEGLNSLEREIDAIAGSDSQGFGLLNKHIQEGAKGFKEFKKETDELPGNLKQVAEDAKKAAEQMKLGYEIMTEAVKRRQEDLGRTILEVAKKGWGDYQEYLGRKILQDARDTANELGRIEERKGKKIQDEAKEAFENVKREQEEAAKEFERTFDLVSRDVGHAISGAFVYDDDIKENFENLGKHLLDNLIASMAAWAIEAALVATGVKAAMAEIFAVPIPQPVVPVAAPGVPGAPVPGSTAGAGGLGTAGSIGVGIVAGVATVDAANRARTGDNGDIAVAFSESIVGAQIGLGVRAFDSVFGGDSESDNTRLARHYGRDRVAMRAAKRRVDAEFGEGTWDSMGYSEKATAMQDLIRFVGLNVNDQNLYDLTSSERAELSRIVQERGLKHGGIVTQEGWFNVGEMGKKEAVIPLENPQAMQQLAAAGFGGNVSINISGTNFWDEITYHKFIRRIKQDLGNRRFA